MSQDHTPHRNIALLTQYFHPEVAATAQLHTDLAIGLQDKGWNVKVFTGQPAYQQKDRQLTYEIHNGVKIRRFYNPGISRRKIIGRLFNAAIVALLMTLHLVTRKRPDIALVDSTTPFLPLVAYILKILRGWKYVFLVEDVYPEIAINLGYIHDNGFLSITWGFFNKLVYKNAKRVIAIGPRMRELLLRKLPEGETEDKVAVIHNWGDGESILPRSNNDNWFRQNLDLTDKTVVLYSGNMGASHDLESVLKSASKLLHVKGIGFVFIGNGAKRARIECMAKELRLTNFFLLPYQERSILPYSITCGDISIITLEPGMEGLSVPSKLYSSLAAGQAVIAIMGEKSEVVDVIQEYQCGIRVPPGDENQLTHIIQDLHNDPVKLQDMKRNARDCFEKYFTMSKAIQSYEKILSNAMK